MKSKGKRGPILRSAEDLSICHYTNQLKRFVACEPRLLTDIEANYLGSEVLMSSYRLV